MSAWYRVAPRRRRGPGATVCRRCGAVVDNRDLVDVIRLGQQVPVPYCDRCADELTGRTP